MADPHTPPMIGRTFGRLRCLKRTNEKNGPHYLYECRCTCGNRVHLLVQGNLLRSGRTVSCGCANRRRRHAQRVTVSIKGEVK